MLFPYIYVPHQMERMQSFVNFIFYQVWCCAPKSGQFNLNLFDANPPLKEVLTDLYYSDKKTGNKFLEQIQAVYQYERSILNGYIEVANQLASIGNLSKSYDLKAKQVQALIQSIEISNDLFKSTRADYLEVLMTQRDALEAKLELIETKKQQLNAMVKVYQALGGGWN